MKEPIKSGDLCEVIGGMSRSKSPNLGLHVKAIVTRGDHSRFGRVWHCEGAGIKQMNDSGGFIETGWADFPTDWLKKIEPPPLPNQAQETNLELTN